jgi:AcrR family transcriptional regulator
MLSPLRRARAERLTGIAEGLFLSRGFRGVTMEDIAAAAGQSKVTLYGYFRDKDAVFAAVADRLAARLLQAVTLALAAPGPVTDRVTAALVTKQEIVSRTVRTSPFAAELFALQDHGAPGRFAALDHQIETAISDVLTGDGRQDAARLARLLLSATAGVAARPEADIGQDCGRVARAILSAGPT